MLLSILLGGNNAHFWDRGIAGLRGTHMYLVDTDQQISIADIPVSVPSSGILVLWSLPFPALMLSILLISAILIGVDWYLVVLIKPFFKNILLDQNQTPSPLERFLLLRQSCASVFREKELRISPAPAVSGTGRGVLQIPPHVPLKTSLKRRGQAWG